MHLVLNTTVSNGTHADLNSTLVETVKKNSIFVTGNVNGAIALAIAGPGLILNVYVLIVMSVVNIAMHSAAAVLLKNQLLVDAGACLFLIIAQFEIPKDNISTISYYILCAGFDRNMFIWYFFGASAANIVAVCVQRYIITVYPFKKISRLNAYITAVGVIVFASAHATFHYGLHMSIDPERNRCVFTYDSLVATWSWVFLYYLIPTVLLIVLYTKIILVLRESAQVQSTKNNSNPEGKVLKNAVVVAVMFILLTAPNTVCSVLLEYNSMDTVIWESFLRRFTYVTAMVNSASTPFVYIIFFSAIRAKTLDCFCLLCRSKTLSNTTSTMSSSTQVSN